MFVLNTQVVDTQEQILALALHSMGTFTTMLVEEGGVRGLEDHLARLERDSMALFGLPVNPELIRENLRYYLAQHAHSQQSALGLIVRVTLFPANLSIKDPANVTELNILVTGRATPPEAGRPMRVGSVAIERLFPQQKNTNLMPALQARKLAQANGFQDALLTHDSIILEGATWNIFFVKGNSMYLPDSNERILPGITQKIIAEIAPQVGFSISKVSIPLNRITVYDGVFATSATGGVVTIESIDTVNFSPDSATKAMMRQLNRHYLMYPKTQI